MDLAMERKVDEAVVHIRNNPGASYISLQRALFAAPEVAEGTYNIKHGSNSNIFQWFSMSREFVKFIAALRASGKVEAHICSKTVYEDAGQVPNCPVAKDPLPRRYKNVHWLPVAFWLKKHTSRDTLHSRS